MAKRRVEKLIESWKAADLSRRHSAPDWQRGYNARYSDPDIQRERADDEAKAAASMARQILIERST